MNKLKEERTNTQILRRDSNRRDVGRSSQLAVKHIINSSKREKKASFSLSYGLNAEHYAYWNYTREITKLPANHTQAEKSKIHMYGDIIIFIIIIIISTAHYSSLHAFYNFKLFLQFFFILSLCSALFFRSCLSSYPILCYTFHCNL